MLNGYDPGGFYCEMLGGSASEVLRERLGGLTAAALRQRAAAAEAELHNLGITFTVWSEAKSIDRILPFDVIPRVIAAKEWAHVERGVTQRLAAINLLLHDLYHDQHILNDGVLPRDLVLGNPCYRPMMQGLDLPYGTYVHINGSDLVRDEHGTFLVLEDNARTPSGVSYVVENRYLMQRAFPDLLDALELRPVENYGLQLAAALREVAPAGCADPCIVLLSPGTYNSAFFEHVFLAREMGVPLVEGRDLVVKRRARVDAHHGRAGAGGRDLSPHRTTPSWIPRRSGRTVCWACLA